jgi:hypothetical protein
MVFEQQQAQSVALDASSAYAAELSSRGGFNLTKLRETLALGPIRGLSWVKCYNDYWANYELQTLGLFTDAIDCSVPLVVDLYVAAFESLVATGSSAAAGSALVGSNSSSAGRASTAVFFNHVTGLTTTVLGGSSAAVAELTALYDALGAAIGTDAGASGFRVVTSYAEVGTSTGYVSCAGGTSRGAALLLLGDLICM